MSKEHNNVTIHLQSGDIIQQRTSFAAMLRQLPSEQFLQCHKCYVVRLDAIREYDGGNDKLTVLTGESLPVSRRRASAVRAAMAEREVRA